MSPADVKRCIVAFVPAFRIAEMRGHLRTHHAMITDTAPQTLAQMVCERRPGRTYPDGVCKPATSRMRDRLQFFKPDSHQGGR